MKVPTSNSFLFNFLILAQTYIFVLSGRIQYDGIVLTSIDVTKVKDKSGYVTFSGGKSGTASKTATFLKNVKQINAKDEGGQRLFEAEKITKGDAKKIIEKDNEDGRGGKPLFCMHGFNVHPGNHLKQLKNLRKKFNKGKFTLVPVIWPTKGETTAYWNDREQGSKIGGAFKTLAADVNFFNGKSLIAHSMGNFVLRNAADARIRFDNIFMVAADVHHDIFKKDYIDGSGPERKDGLNICNMLKDKKKGKVHVCYNGADYALNGAAYIPSTFFTRLGTVGSNQKKNWFGFYKVDNSLVHDECKNCVTNFDAGSKFFSPAHSYQFNDFMVEYYQKHHI